MSLGLRSGKIGEQCEAVVLFPKLFQKYPFPILINSAFLKLADIFRLGYGSSLVLAKLFSATVKWTKGQIALNLRHKHVHEPKMTVFMQLHTPLHPQHADQQYC